MSAIATSLQKKKKSHLPHLFIHMIEATKRAKQNQATYIKQYGQNELLPLLCYERQNGKKRY